MRIKRVVSYLVVVVMGVGLLLPGNIALAKEVAENVEAGVVQEIIVQSLIGTRQMAGLTISGKSAEVTAYASGQGDIKKISMIVGVVLAYFAVIGIINKRIKGTTKSNKKRKNK